MCIRLSRDATRTLTITTGITFVRSHMTTLPRAKRYSKSSTPFTVRVTLLLQSFCVAHSLSRSSTPPSPTKSRFFWPSTGWKARLLIS